MTKFYHGGLKEIIIPKRLLTLLHGVMSMDSDLLQWIDRVQVYPWYGHWCIRESTWYLWFSQWRLVTEIQYLNLRDTEMHWSLFTYGTGHNIRYCIVYGTMALLNNDSRGFNMLNIPVVLLGMIETSLSTLSIEIKIVVIALDTMLMINALKLTCT